MLEDAVQRIADELTRLMLTIEDNKLVVGENYQWLEDEYLKAEAALSQMMAILSHVERAANYDTDSKM